MAEEVVQGVEAKFKAAQAKTEKLGGGPKAQPGGHRGSKRRTRHCYPPVLLTAAVGQLGRGSG
jgi:hypothetical protein